MKGKINSFVLAGNGPYENRGCEAIARGTIKILNSYFNSPKLKALSFYSSESQFEKELAEETDKNIVHKKTHIFGTQKAVRILNKILMMSLGGRARAKLIYREMLPDLKEGCAVLSVGGDNYSLDYGKPTFFIDLDNLVLEAGLPIVIWGASVGPFLKDKKYEIFMRGHLKKATGIFARDPITIEYLNNIGVTKNVYRVADPAFLLNPVEPPDEKFLDKNNLADTVGINLSPLMARFITNGDVKKWVRLGAEIVKKVSERVKRPIYLVPHVTSPGANDYEFMQKVIFCLDKTRNNVILAPNNLNASETKWLISRMSVFAGCRTHSVISALSSSVPALSLSYSIKGRGIIRDVFGDEHFSILKKDFTPEIISEKVSELEKESTNIKSQINRALPKIEALAMDAGEYLKNILNSYK
jgi:polysaccharide pyruvyl transferase WcaK-like protein